MYKNFCIKAPETKVTTIVPMPIGPFSPNAIIKKTVSMYVFPNLILSLYIPYASSLMNHVNIESFGV